MIKLKLLIIAICYGLFAINLSAQKMIHLENPSFEDVPRHSKPPVDWSDCGDANESPPDVQPYGGFQVTHSAHHGNTYVAMVVRDNNTTEAIGQRLSEPLMAGKCYNFSVFLSRSNYYVSLSRRTLTEENYITPAKMKIWGGDKLCNRTEFLGETALIDHNQWIEYIFNFTPVQDLDYLVFEASYQEPNLFPYNGNILLDNASPIVEVPCDAEVSTTLQTFYTVSTETIILQNKSFEETYDHEKKAKFWQFCNPDEPFVTIEPIYTPHQMPIPKEGINYLSLTVDDNTLKGGVNTALMPYLQPAAAYRFSLDAAHSDYLMRESIFIKKELTNFDGGAKIKIWGGNEVCEREELLAETPMITHKDWKKYEFILQPQQRLTHLLIEAAYDTPIQFFYNGHVLIDDLSDLELLNSDSLEYYYEQLDFPITTTKDDFQVDSNKYPWKNPIEKPKDKIFKSFTYSVRDSEESINEHLEKLLHQAYPNYLLLFNIFAPTKEDGGYQEDLLIKALDQLNYPENWYKTKTYLED